MNEWTNVQTNDREYAGREAQHGGTRCNWLTFAEDLIHRKMQNIDVLDSVCADATSNQLACIDYSLPATDSANGFSWFLSLNPRNNPAW